MAALRREAECDDRGKALKRPSRGRIPGLGRRTLWCPVITGPPTGLVTAGASAVLDLFEKRHMVEHVRKIGATWLKKLDGLVNEI